VGVLQVLEELELRASHVDALEERLLPEERQIDGARGERAVPKGVADEDGDQPGGGRSPRELDELGVPRVARRMVRALADPQEHLLARWSAGEPPRGPGHDRRRDRRISEEATPHPALG
jgi:hypothetical protein